MSKDVVELRRNLEKIRAEKESLSSAYSKLKKDLEIKNDLLCAEMNRNMNICENESVYKNKTLMSIYEERQGLFRSMQNIQSNSYDKLMDEFDKKTAEFEDKENEILKSIKSLEDKRK